MTVAGGFIEAAQKAVRDWLFLPALDASKPISSEMDVHIIFSPDNPYFRGPASDFPPEEQWPYRPPVTEAKLISEPDIDYPDSLFDRRLSGWAHFSCIVLPNGNTANPRILSATHVDFVYPALRALEHLKYSPRTYGDTPIEAEVEGELKFDLFSRDKVGVLAANNITSPDGGAPSADLEPSMIVDPIFPYDLLLRGESGWATVSFTVNESGAPAEVRTTSASDIPFGNALIAAVEMSKFSPPVLEGRSVKVQLQRHEIFSAAGSASTAEMSSRARLLMSIRANHVTGGQRLDEDLVPLYRISPRYPELPASAGRPPGDAEIEFIIDRDGRAQLPRVISAARDEFGWAAATAAGQWVFKAPSRNKQPVDVKVRVSFVFKAQVK